MQKNITTGNYFSFNEQSKKKLKKVIQFIIASQKIKYIRINIARKVQDLYTENSQTMLKGIKGGTGEQ